MGFQIAGKRTMKLRSDRAGPYARALAAGLYALAPHGDYVPIAEALATLKALDPALSGDLLLPATVDPYEGMPALSWVQRARAEQRLAGGPAPDEHAVASARRSDPALADRLEHRRALWAFLKDAALLPSSRVVAEPRRLGRTVALALRHDRLAPSGWERLRVELVADDARGRARLMSGPVQLDDVGRTSVNDSLRHLLTRHATAPLTALREQLADTLGVQVSRVSRATVGPFWFPGVALPHPVPAELGRGLILNLHAEVLARDVRRSAHRDPLTPPPPGERLPEGFGVYRERRFAASADVVDALRAWTAARGAPADPVPLVPIR